MKKMIDMRDLCTFQIVCQTIVVSVLITGCGSGTTPPENSEESEIVVSSQSKTSLKANKSELKPASETSVNEPATKGNATPDAVSKKQMQKVASNKVYRPSDQRPIHNDQRLAQLGIHRYESPRLKLYTDIDPQLAATLPAVVDQAYLALVDYFGPLPPDREGTEFQVTGYIMQNRERFRNAGVILKSLPKIVNGRHQGAQFWMDAQSEQYYLRHLMLHEYTHCYSMIMENIGAPVWYLEGIAESMATHHIDQNQKIRFNVMPRDKNDFAGLGRISLIEEAVRNAPPKSMLEVMQVESNDFVNNNEIYAWSWALCQFFDKHPRFTQSFHQLSRHMQGTEFSQKIKELMKDDFLEINDAWLLFARSLQLGYDFDRAAINFQKGEPLTSPAMSANVLITSDRGWQSSLIHVEQGETYTVTSEGTFILAQEPKPWESTADGISFRYFKGQPLGRLTMLIRPDSDARRLNPTSGFKEYPLGANATWMAPVSGTIYFRLNDAWDELADNQGSVKVTVTQMSDTGSSGGLDN